MKNLGIMTRKEKEGEEVPKKEKRKNSEKERNREKNETCNYVGASFRRHQENVFMVTTTIRLWFKWFLA